MSACDWEPEALKRQFDAARARIAELETKLALEDGLCHARDYVAGSLAECSLPACHEGVWHSDHGYHNWNHPGAVSFSVVQELRARIAELEADAERWKQAYADLAVQKITWLAENARLRRVAEAARDVMNCGEKTPGRDGWMFGVTVYRALWGALAALDALKTLGSSQVERHAAVNGASAGSTPASPANSEARGHAAQGEPARPGNAGHETPGASDSPTQHPGSVTGTVPAGTPNPEHGGSTPPAPATPPTEKCACGRKCVACIRGCGTVGCYVCVLPIHQCSAREPATERLNAGSSVGPAASPPEKREPHPWRSKGWECACGRILNKDGWPHRAADGTQHSPDGCEFSEKLANWRNARPCVECGHLARLHNEKNGCSATFPLRDDGECPCDLGPDEPAAPTQSRESAPPREPKEGRCSLCSGNHEACPEACRLIDYWREKHRQHECSPAASPQVEGVPRAELEKLVAKWRPIGEDLKRGDAEEQSAGAAYLDCARDLSRLLGGGAEPMKPKEAPGE